jgi:hypothetical protein
MRHDDEEGSYSDQSYSMTRDELGLCAQTMARIEAELGPLRILLRIQGSTAFVQGTVDERWQIKALHELLESQIGLSGFESSLQTVEDLSV